MSINVNELAIVSKHEAKFATLVSKTLNFYSNENFENRDRAIKFDHT